MTVSSSGDDIIALRAVRGFHVGGEQVALSGLPVAQIVAIPGSAPRPSDPNGHYQVGQLYVQRFELAAPRAPVPLLLWHGGGLSGVTWEDTPDGRPGWLDFFLRHGWECWVSDAVERGRASWARYPEINPGPPEHRPIDQAWGMFRFGPDGGYSPDPARRQCFPGLRFPVAAADAFEKQFVARWTTSNAAAQRAYDALVRRAGPCVLLAHSQGGRFAMQAAATAPQLVRALVLIEPAGGLDPQVVSPAPLRGVPTLVVWGDFHAQSASWQSHRARAERWFAAVREAGGQIDVLDLPAHGVHGNSHMLMMDDNNDAIAARVQDWLAGRALRR